MSKKRDLLEFEAIPVAAVADHHGPAGLLAQVIDHLLEPLELRRRRLVEKAECLLDAGGRGHDHRAIS